MCRVHLVGWGHSWYESLDCSPDADYLFSLVQERATQSGARVVAIEPCMIALSSAVSSRRPHAGD